MKKLQQPDIAIQSQQILRESLGRSVRASYSTVLGTSIMKILARRIQDLPTDVQRSPFSIACESRANLLIEGPTGSGKSTLARQVHDRSDNKEGPYVVVNLATLSDGLVESELFGHERGSFTGAHTRRKGRVEEAQGGTLFLDEIGEFPLSLQPRLLEFLQERTIVPVGGNRPRHVDVRIIAATNRELEREVARGRFREDLFHRIRVLRIRQKSLYERREEFNEILHSQIADLAKLYQKPVFGLTEEVAELFEGYRWPGNIRELRNVLESALVSTTGKTIRAEDLPDWFIEGILEKSSEGCPIGVPEGGELGTVELGLKMSFDRSLQAFEREFLHRALIHFDGRVNQTARMIGMNKTTLIRRMRTYGLTREETR